MKNIAVITIDVINSTGLSAALLEQVLNRLGQECSTLKRKKWISYYETFRGDSMQIIVANPEKALRVGFILKTAVNHFPQKDEAIKHNGNKLMADIRFAIGIGETEQGKLQKMTNEKPFVRSGRKLDQIQQENRKTGVISGQSHIDGELETELYLYEGISRRWTKPVAEVVYHKLYRKTEQIIADKLKISQSAVNQRSHSAYWNGLDLLLNRYEKLITGTDHE